MNTYKFINPTESEIAELCLKHNLIAGHLHDALDVDEIPRVEVEYSDIYIFLRFPQMDQASHLTDFTSPFLLIVKQEERAVYIISRYDNLCLTTIEDSNFLESISKLIKNVIHLFAKETQKIGKKTYALRKESNISINNKQITDLLGFEEELNDLTTSLIQNKSVSLELDKLLKKDTDYIADNWEDILLYLEQTIENTKNTLKSVKNTRETYSIIITNNLNNVIKLFTSLTVIFAIPTIIFSFYGMNIDLPIFPQYTTEAIIIGTIIVILITSYLFKKKDWV